MPGVLYEKQMQTIERCPEAMSFAHFNSEFDGFDTILVCGKIRGIGCNSLQDWRKLPDVLCYLIVVVLVEGGISVLHRCFAT